MIEVDSQHNRTIAVLAGHAPSLVIFRGPLIRLLAEMGHRVIAMAPTTPGWSERIEQLGATFAPVEFARASIDPIGDLKAYMAIRRVLDRHSVDTLLAYTIKPIVYGLPAALRAGVATRVALVTGLGYAFGSETLRQRIVSAVAGRLYRKALAQATAVRFQNPDDQRFFVDSGFVSMDRTDVVAGSGVDLDFYPFVDPPTSPSVQFLLIARLLADKGIREYVRAARVVRAKLPDTTFRLVGPPDPNPMAIQPRELDEWRAEGIVDVLPGTDDVRPHLAACDVYVLPSYREGTPRTVLEAMATGRPIVTTDAPGCRETTKIGENGFLVPVRDPDALAMAMIRLAEDRALRERMGRRSRAIAEEKYDVRRVNDAMMRAMGLSPRLNGSHVEARP